MTNPKTPPSPPKDFLRKLRRLDLPARAKSILQELYEQAASLVRRLVEFLYHNRIFAAYLVLGICLYWALGPIPVVGSLLAALGLSFSILLRLFKQIESDFRSQMTVLVGRPV